MCVTSLLCTGLSSITCVTLLLHICLNIMMCISLLLSIAVLLTFPDWIPYWNEYLLEIYLLLCLTFISLESVIHNYSKRLQMS
jgi:hypothetical protein